MADNFKMGMPASDAIKQLNELATEVENIKENGGGSGSTGSGDVGTTLYRHQIKIELTGQSDTTKGYCYAIFTLYSKRATAFTTLSEIHADLRPDSEEPVFNIPCAGLYTANYLDSYAKRCPVTEIRIMDMTFAQDGTITANAMYYNSETGKFGAVNVEEPYSIYDYVIPVAEGGVAGGGGSGGDAIIHVDSLPTENINEKAIYRVKGIKCYPVLSLPPNLIVPNVLTPEVPARIYTVDTLPTSGEPALDTYRTRAITYYQKSDGVCYCWVTTQMGMPMDMWVTLEQLLPTYNLPFGGVVNSLEDVLQSSAGLFVVKSEFSKSYIYENGWKSLGNESRVFNFTRSDIEGDVVPAQLGGNSLTQCNELFSYLYAMYDNIASIRYNGISFGGGMSAPALLVNKRNVGLWELDVPIDTFNSINTGFALSSNGVLSFSESTWEETMNDFQIVVSIY